MNGMINRVLEGNTVETLFYKNTFHKFTDFKKHSAVSADFVKSSLRCAAVRCRKIKKTTGAFLVTALKKSEFTLLKPFFFFTSVLATLHCNPFAVY